MNSISEFWNKSKETFEKKSLLQILSFAGDGKLRDNNVTSKEFRELLDQVPTTLLKQFANNCLTEKFDDNGFALQDIINQVGVRLGFNVEYGLYRGKRNEIGFDGIWKSKDGYSIIVEVKTTDTYRINLDDIAAYRAKLILHAKVYGENSSILIIVGRQDTGDMEAQIRGSKHAWDIRLLSTDSLINLLSLKENLNDAKTIQQINELLKPKEYTRIDTLIELIFQTSKDLKLEEEIEIEVESLPKEKKTRKSSDIKTIPVNFHEECLKKIQRSIGVNLIKQSRISFVNRDKTIGLTCSISRAHKQGQHNKFWFAFHPHQNDFLKEFPKAYVSYGCGSAENTFLIPYIEFVSLVKSFWTTENEERMYWHVVILERDNKFLLQLPRNPKNEFMDITKYKI
jgi:hypothetical protein